MLDLTKKEKGEIYDILQKLKEEGRILGKCQESIERQSAARSTAILLANTTPTPETIRLYFDVFLKLIKGD